MEENEKQPCSFDCGNKYETEALKKHENSCLHQPCECPFVYVGTCYWKGIKKDLSDHLLTHTEEDFTKVSLETNKNDGCASARKCWFKMIYIGDPSYVCKLKCNIILGTNKEENDIQVKMCGIKIANDVKWKFDEHEMKMLDLNELEHIFGKDITEILCKFEIFDGNFFLNDNEKHLTDSNILLELECPVCKEYMLFKIFICPEGHSFCGNCKSNLNSCPVCRQTLCKSSRNIALEAIAQHLIYPCRNEECDFIGNSAEIQKHHKHCVINV